MVDIYSLQILDSVVTIRDYLRIMSVSTYDCNRDGVALRFVGQKLLNGQRIKNIINDFEGTDFIPKDSKGEIAKQIW